MYTSSWSAAELRELMIVLRSSHRVRIEIDLLDTDHNGLGAVDNRLLSGAVDVDADAAVSRSLKLSLLDVDHTLNLDRENPAQGSMYLNRMVRVRYCVGRIDGTKWWEVPVFTGPITKLNRDGVVLNIEAQGKESMADSNSWRARSWKKGWLRSNIIRAVMQDVGETLFRFSPSQSKTSSETNLKRDNSPFNLAKTLARAMNQILFYNGNGQLVLRRRSTKSVWTFDGRSRITTPEVNYDLEGFYNAVQVKGGTPKGRKNAKPKKAGEKTKAKQRSARVVAKRSHELSPWSLRRNGKPRYEWIEVSDDSLKTNAECRKFGQEVLARGLLQAVDSSFTAFVIPMLEENDKITVVSDKYNGASLAKKFTIPLTLDVMSVGYNKKVRPSKLSRRMRRK